MVSTILSFNLHLHPHHQNQNPKPNYLLKKSSIFPTNLTRKSSPLPTKCYPNPSMTPSSSSNQSQLISQFGEAEPDPTLINDDLKPTPPAHRTMSGVDMASLWSWIGGEAILLLHPESVFLAESANWLGTSPLAFACFIVFLAAAALGTFWNGIEGIQQIEKYAAPVLSLLTLSLLTWSYVRTGGFGHMPLPLIKAFEFRILGSVIPFSDSKHQFLAT
ncbi:hypothetical protein SASPL_111716 [Salvia splendens]|uniref:Uncharacterized protein n=1 Tax=Salvia splendens TaxID=180675 RepID=A0A8X8YCZ7_SALSN|nr:hypothetical protein SASPL_111716 [Salvia splendens]